MRKFCRRAAFAVVLAVAIVAAAALASGCGRKIDGPRFWWDDRNQARLPDSYALPEDVGAPADHGVEPLAAQPSGEDLSEDNLRDYRTDIDREEEKRKSEASLLDF